MKGGSSSTTTKEDVTNVTTNTTTTIRDIGLTGQNAVDALATLEGGVIARSEIAAKMIQSASADISKGYNNLGAVTQDVLKNFTQTVAKAGQDSAGKVEAIATDNTKKFVFITGAALAVVALMAIKR